MCPDCKGLEHVTRKKVIFLQVADVISFLLGKPMLVQVKKTTQTKHRILNGT